jgi:hypothetical protein
MNQHVVLLNLDVTFVRNIGSAAQTSAQFNCQAYDRDHTKLFVADCNEYFRSLAGIAGELKRPPARYLSYLSSEAVSREGPLQDDLRWQVQF